MSIRAGGVDGFKAPGELGANLAIQLDDVTTSNVTYVGKAAIGSATSSAVWQIFKLDESGSPITLVITWADSNDSYDNVWNDRASLTYG